MYTRNIFLVLSVFALATCAVVILSVSSRSTTAQDNGFKTRMQQEIIQTLKEIIMVREQELVLAQAKLEQMLIISLEVEKAQVKLSEARLRLAVAEHQPDVAMKEFRSILAVHEKLLQFLDSKVEQGVITNVDVAEERVQLLEDRLRLATAIRDMQ